MALPMLSELSGSPGKVMESIRQTIAGKPAANDSQASREPAKPPEVEKVSKSNVVDMQKFRQRKQSQSIERVSSKGMTSNQMAEAANDKAIEKSQSQINPLIPLLHSMNHTVSSINGTLKSILFVLKKQAETLSKVLSKTNIGDSNDDDSGGNDEKEKKKPKEKSRRERARDRLRERRQRQRDRARPPGRLRRGLRAGAAAGKKGILGLAGVLGLDQLLPDAAQDVIEAGSTRSRCC